MSTISLTTIICIVLTLEANAYFTPIPYGRCKTCRIINCKEDIEFHLYTRRNPSMPYILQIGSKKRLSSSPLSRENRTVMYIHGYGSSVNKPTSIHLRSGYLTLDDYNVILVNWKKLAAKPWYYHAKTNIKIVGAYIAELLQWLEHYNSISISDLHIIGYNLGAHAAGFVGKFIGSHKIGRITGLDPSAPAFLYSPDSKRLDKKDAIFVDVIHADLIFKGSSLPVGHADFYPNRGLWQPGCEIVEMMVGGLRNLIGDVCLQERSVLYYIESLRNPFGFPAERCQIWFPVTGVCSKKIDAFMGFAADPKDQGIFFLKTNLKWPYARNYTDYYKNSITNILL